MLVYPRRRPSLEDVRLESAPRDVPLARDPPDFVARLLDAQDLQLEAGHARLPGLVRAAYLRDDQPRIGIDDHLVMVCPEVLERRYDCQVFRLVAGVGRHGRERFFAGLDAHPRVAGVVTAGAVHVHLDAHGACLPHALEKSLQLWELPKSRYMKSAVKTGTYNPPPPSDTNSTVCYIVMVADEEGKYAERVSVPAGYFCADHTIHATVEPARP